MRIPPDSSSRQLEIVILLFLFAVFLLASPFAMWWAADSSPWYVPYLAWLVVIALAALVQRRYFP
jgi:hypothetical protein